jgi:hypothetical protein
MGPRGEIECDLGHGVARFVPSADGLYSVEIQGLPNLRPLFEDLATLDEDYKRNVQAAVYNTLKGRIAEQHMTVESEQVTEDNSILLTLTIQD